MLLNPRCRGVCYPPPPTPQCGQFLRTSASFFPPLPRTTPRGRSRYPAPTCLCKDPRPNVEHWHSTPTCEKWVALRGRAETIFACMTQPLFPERALLCIGTLRVAPKGKNSKGWCLSNPARQLECH